MIMFKEEKNICKQLFRAMMRIYINTNNFHYTFNTT